MTHRGIVARAALGAILLQPALFSVNVDVGAEAPDFSGTWLNREGTNLKDLRGYAVLVEFWATW